MKLEPGSNVFVLARKSGSEDSVASEVATAVGSSITPAGNHGGWRFYVGGFARPVSVRPKEVTSAILTRYVEAGAPAGPLPLMFTVGVDWRGVSQDVKLDPLFDNVVRGKPTWPDLSAAELSTYLSTADKSTFEQAIGALKEGASEAADKVASGSSVFLWGVASSVVGWLIISRLSRR
jgi:hypothetical protein